MKHKLITFFFLIALGFSFNLITPTDSKAGEFACEKDAAGAIIVHRRAEKMFNLTDAAQTQFDQCSEEPDFYKVLVYKLAICREDPFTADGLALPNYETCVTLIDDFAKTDADATIIQPVLETILPIPSVAIPVGTYPFATLIVDSKIKIKHTQTYSYHADINVDEIGTHKGMRGVEAIAGTDNNDLGNGAFNTVCWSLDKVTTLHNDAYAANNAYPVAHGLGTSTAVIEPVGNQSTSTMQCGTAAGTAEFSTEIIDDMRDSGTDFVSFENYSSVADATGLDGIEMAALLLEDEATISTGLTKSKLLSINYRYAAPIQITEQTIGLNVRIKTSSAISLDWGWDSTNVAFWGTKQGANAFTTTFLTKSRRSRGSWR